MSLTRKQHQLLAFIADYQAKADGVSPTFDEMKAAVGLVSKSGIHRLLQALIERGYVAQLPHRARAITLLKTPDGMDILGVTAPQGSINPKWADFYATSNAITRLYVHGLLTDREKDKVRRRFLKTHGAAA